MGLFDFLHRGSRQNAPVPLMLDETVVWAIGDIHGRADLLGLLLPAILEDLEQSSAQRRILVGLGDYVDRGYDSRSVLNFLCAFQDQTGIECHFLRGNHEDRFEAFLTDPSVGPAWCEFGGRETLASFGIAPPHLTAGADIWETASAALATNLTDRHRRFLGSQRSSLTLGDYFFSHAGARPGVPLDQQTPDDLMWIRADFLNHTRRFEKIVVHGHTPEDRATIDHRRIGIDTGAYATGVLTAIRLEGPQVALLQTRNTELEAMIAR
ncbi:metallophosphoesterase family protein [soil metagenome]